MPLDRPGKHSAFDVGAEALEGRDIVAVRDADHVLFDDRTGVGSSVT